MVEMQGAARRSTRNQRSNSKSTKTRAFVQVGQGEVSDQHRHRTPTKKVSPPKPASNHGKPSLINTSKLFEQSSQNLSTLERPSGGIVR